MSDRMKPVMVRFPAKVLEHVREAAKAEHVSVSELIRIAVRSYLGGVRITEPLKMQVLRMLDDDQFTDAFLDALEKRGRERRKNK